MKFFWLFSYDSGEACGGMCDFIGAYSSFEEARRNAENLDEDYYEIVDVRDPEKFYQGCGPTRAKCLLAYNTPWGRSRAQGAWRET